MTGCEGREWQPEERLDRVWLQHLFAVPEDYAPHAVLHRPTEGHGSTGHHSPDKRYPECKSGLGQVCFANNVIKILDGDVERIYLIDDYDPETDSWRARWPD